MSISRNSNDGVRRYRIETRRMNKGAIDILLKSDQRALHARIAVAWQIASEFIFPGHIDKDALSSDLAGLYFQAKIECWQNNAMLRLSCRVVENERYRTPSRHLKLRRH